MDVLSRQQVRRAKWFVFKMDTYILCQIKKEFLMHNL